MAVQTLKVDVDVTIADAIAALNELKEELEQLADKISQVDLRGTEGIDVNTDVDQIDDDLAAMAAKIRAFETATDIDIDSNVRGGGGGGGFNRPFMAAGSLAASRAGRVGQGFELLDDIGSDPDMFQRLSKAVDGLIEDVDGFKLRMSDLHNLMAGFIPVLLVFIGAIPTAITALLTLAAAAFSAVAAFGAIGALGALGVGLQDGQFDMERLTEVVDIIRDDFIEAFAPLAERLEPLFRDGLSGLEAFFQAVAGQGDALMSLTDEAGAFGRFMIDFVPLVLRNMAALAEAFGDVFGELGDFLQNNLTNIVREFVDITLEALPALIKLGENLALLAKFLARAGIGFSLVSSAVLDFAGGLSLIFNLVGITDAQLGLLLGTLLSVVSVLSLTSFVIGNAMLGAVWGWIGALNMAIARNVILSSTLMTGVVNALASAIVSLFAAAGAQISFASATLIASAALASFLTLASLGILAGLGAVALDAASDFLGLADSINQASNSMQEFNRVSGLDSPGTFNPYGEGGGSRGGTAMVGGGGGTTINMESTGSKEQDSSNMQKVRWYQGRTSGSRP